MVPIERRRRRSRDDDAHSALRTNAKLNLFRPRCDEAVGTLLCDMEPAAVLQNARLVTDRINLTIW
jgi:hypothetical protein